MNARVVRSFVWLTAIGALAGEALAADNWPQWRGPLATGVAADGNYPVKFSSDEGVAWKVAIPGRGFSTPIVWGDAIFLTGGVNGQDTVMSYDLSGKPRWQKSLGPERPGKHGNGSGSNPSPVTDGQSRVISYFKSGTVVCHDFDGNEVWRKNLQDEYGKDTLWWDLGVSPIIAAGQVVIAVMQSGDSYLVALDLATGEESWFQQRQYDTQEESDHAYTTPQVVKIDEREVIVTFGADHLTGHDAASGKLLWESGGFNPEDEANWRVIASQAVGDGVVVVPYGRGKFLAAVKLGGSGDVTESHRLWDLSGDAGTDVPTPVIDGGRLLVLGDRGRVTCRDLQSGDEIWAGDLPKNRNKFYASPLLAGGRLYCAREDGMVFVVDAQDRFELLAENDMGEKIIATPVGVRGGLLIRGEKHLFWIGSEESLASPAG
jgi:outer membrane protein assembly factor BamB